MKVTYLLNDLHLLSLPLVNDASSLTNTINNFDELIFTIYIWRFIDFLYTKLWRALTPRRLTFPYAIAIDGKVILVPRSSSSRPIRLLCAALPSRLVSRRNRIKSLTLFRLLRHSNDVCTLSKFENILR